MGKDEVGTLARLKSLHKNLVHPTISDNNGRIVKLMGDGLLAEFSSVVDAVQCAANIQQSMVKRETELDNNQRIRLRIGVNLGDIIVEGSDIYGDGVNIAARLEGLAEPGGLCVSAKVYEEVRNKLSISFKDMGALEVKNIQEPIRVYSWIKKGSSTSSVGPKAGLPLSDKPSVAVLPFNNMSGDPEQEYFSDGITEDIITELSRFRSLFVIARNSSFAFKGQATNITEVGKKLGVKFVVEGSVRKAGNRIRITAQLIEASTGNHLWAERYDRNLDDIFTVQDEVASKIVTMVPGHVEKADYVQAERKPARDINAYDLFLRAMNILGRNYGSREGEKLLKRALEIDPGYAIPHAHLSIFYAFSVFTHGLNVDETSSLARVHAEAALKLDPDDPAVHISLAVAYVMCGEHALARHHMDKAIALNPNDYVVMLMSAEVMTYLGDYDTAVQWADKAARSDPYSIDTYRETYFDLYYMRSEYEKALEHLVGWQDHPLHIYLAKAAALAQLNRIEEAHESLRKLDKNRPADWDRVGVMSAYVRMCALPEDGERWLEGFRKAGLDI